MWWPHAFNPSTGEAEAGGSLCESEASLIYRVNSGQPGLYRETLSVAPVLGHPHLLSASLDSGRVHGTHTYMQAKHSNINKILRENNK